MANSSLQARQHGDLYLPVYRSNEGLSDDLAYIQSAIEQVDALSQYCPLTAATRVLDFGCGQGRFANGLIARGSNVKGYCGVDTSLESIDWCRRWIQEAHQGFIFLHVPAFNARYSPAAEPVSALPIGSCSFDVAFLNSVFSHMLASDVQFYLAQMRNALRNGGIIYMTAFVEPNVPVVEENPEGYLGKTSVGPLHRVRYEQSFFLRLVESAGFNIVDFRHQAIERTRQSVIVAERRA